MPPKKQSAPSNKTIQKEKAKIVEDKTFGLKNKNKSSKVQKYVKTVESQVKNPNKKRGPEINQKELLKEEKKKQEDELKMLFKPVTTQVIPAGADPKSIVCEFFKKGLCTKGTKCKFSHDLTTARKSEKIDVYTDRRGLDDDEKVQDTIDKWDDEKLAKVVEEKHGTELAQPQTDIVCKYFLEALEKRQYGWFWVCPNGGDQCKYKHALPPGYALKKEEKKKDEDEIEIPLEELLDEERKHVVGKTPVTLETFLEWKKRKKQKREADLMEVERKKSEDIKSGKKIMSGRDLFTYNPDLFVDDEEGGALDMDEYAEQTDDNEVELEITATSIVRHVKEKTANGEDGSEEGSADGEDNHEASNESGGEQQEENESGDEKEVPVDESLFLEDEDVPEEEQ